MSDETMKLADCPFCGQPPWVMECNVVSQPDAPGETYNLECIAKCSNCGIEMVEECRNDLAKRWNTRAAPAGCPYYTAIDEALVVRHLGVAKGDAKAELNTILKWEVDVALDPRVSKDAQDLVDRGLREAADIARNWRVSPIKNGDLTDEQLHDMHNEIGPNIAEAILSTSVAPASVSPMVIQKVYETSQSMAAGYRRAITDFSTAHQKELSEHCAIAASNTGVFILQALGLSHEAIRALSQKGS